MTSTYEKIATTTLTSNQASVTFSSISGSYTDLILIAQGTNTTSAQSLRMTFNGITTTTYSRTAVFGDGSSAQSTRDTNISGIDNIYYGTTQAVAIVQIMNYSNTTTNKTVISRNNDSASAVNAVVGLWRSTNAINSITMTAQTSNIASGSTFTLYGIKAE
jgi:hypothetical protein